MNSVSGPEPKPEENAKPPKRNWEAARKERFFDLKFSHYVELILTAILVGVGYLQFKVYTRQAGIMEQQTTISQAEHRPWVSANPIGLFNDLLHDTSGLRIILQFALKNTGHSPARRTFIAVVPMLPGFTSETWQQTCKMAESDILGLAIFPGDTIFQGIGGVTQEENFVRFKKLMTAPSGEMPGIIPWVHACIAYQDMETEKFHHTPYGFELTLPDGHSSPITLMLNPGTIHRSDVILRSSPTSFFPPD